MATRLIDDTYPAWLGKDERQLVRIPVAWNATISADKFDEQSVCISDCTARGCRVETQLAVTVGTFVHLTIPRFATVPGWVAWSSSVRGPATRTANSRWTLRTIEVSVK